MLRNDVLELERRKCHHDGEGGHRHQHFYQGKSAPWEGARSYPHITPPQASATASASEAATAWATGSVWGWTLAAASQARTTTPAMRTPRAKVGRCSDTR